MISFVYSRINSVCLQLQRAYAHVTIRKNSRNFACVIQGVYAVREVEVPELAFSSCRRNHVSALGGPQGLEGNVILPNFTAKTHT